MRIIKTAHATGAIILLLAIMAVDGGALGLAVGSILMIVGAMLMLATMRGTGWYE